MSKRALKKVRKSRRKKPTIDVSVDDEKSFGSILDEVGFQPLRKRILISTKREKETESDDGRTGTPVVKTCPVDDPLGYDTGDPSWHRKAARDALSGSDRDAIRREVRRTMRRWNRVRRTE